MEILNEVKKAIVGKDKEIEAVMTAIVAGGHILIEDMPGVGKTTMALAFAKAMGLDAKRVQFTPDVMPSDLTGFSIYQKETGTFTYQPGAVMCNLLLADEINRTSPKTQAALLEIMEERKVTVDGVTRQALKPFIVIATQNPEGSAGTQLLPESQLDRFMVCVHMGYPTIEEEVEILKRRSAGNPLDQVRKILDASTLCRMQEEIKKVYVHDLIYKYMASLASATRNHDFLAEGISPRGTVALTAMSKATAWLSGRSYVLPEDVQKVFLYVALHRVRLSTKAKVSHVQIKDLLEQILEEVEAPSVRKEK